MKNFSRFLKRCSDAGSYKCMYLSLAAACLAVSLTLYISSARKQEEAVASSVAPQVLRFHVLANSDSNEDQKLKFGVRDLLLEEIRRGFSSDEEGEEQTSQKARLQSYILLHRDELETLAESFLEKQGKPDQVQIRLESAYFPTRFYGDIVFPCGIYDAVRVIIGEGNGHNWWCVLYPSLCFTEEACAVVPSESRKELACLLDESVFEEISADRRLVFGESAGIAQNEKKGGKESPSSRQTPSGEDSRPDTSEKPVVHISLRILEFFR